MSGSVFGSRPAFRNSPMISPVLRSMSARTACNSRASAGFVVGDHNCSFVRLLPPTSLFSRFIASLASRRPALTAPRSWLNSAATSGAPRCPGPNAQLRMRRRTPGSPLGSLFSKMRPTLASTSAVAGLGGGGGMDGGGGIAGVGPGATAPVGGRRSSSSMRSAFSCSSRARSASSRRRNAGGRRGVGRPSTSPPLPSMSAAMRFSARFRAAFFCPSVRAGCAASRSCCAVPAAAARVSGVTVRPTMASTWRPCASRAKIAAERTSAFAASASTSAAGISAWRRCICCAVVRARRASFSAACAALRNACPSGTLPARCSASARACVFSAA